MAAPQNSVGTTPLQHSVFLEQAVIDELAENSTIGGLVMQSLIGTAMIKDDLMAKVANDYKTATLGEKSLGAARLAQVIDEGVIRGELEYFRIGHEDYIRMTAEAEKKFTKVGGTD